VLTRLFIDTFIKHQEFPGGDWRFLYSVKNRQHLKHVDRITLCCPTWTAHLKKQRNRLTRTAKKTTLKQPCKTQRRKGQRLQVALRREKREKGERKERQRKQRRKRKDGKGRGS
jgi:hypothetical protein